MSEVQDNNKWKLYNHTNSTMPHTIKSMIPIEESGATFKVKIRNESNISLVKADREKSLLQSSTKRENSRFFCAECDFHSVKKRVITMQKEKFHHQTYYLCSECAEKVPVNMTKRHKFKHREKTYTFDQCDKKNVL